MDGFRTIKKVCLFCGKERDVLIYETNGIDDWTGRQNATQGGMNLMTDVHARLER